MLALTPVVTASQAESTAEAASCTPGYSPCIARKASDVDCYGGGGNGPRYTRRGVVYKVRRGYDRYRLDADRDGKGCALYPQFGDGRTDVRPSVIPP